MGRSAVQGYSLRHIRSDKHTRIAAATSTAPSLSIVTQKRGNHPHSTQHCPTYPGELSHTSGYNPASSPPTHSISYDGYQPPQQRETMIVSPHSLSMSSEQQQQQALGPSCLVQQGPCDVERPEDIDLEDGADEEEEVTLTQSEERMSEDSKEGCSEISSEDEWKPEKKWKADSESDSSMEEQGCFTSSRLQRAFSGREEEKPSQAFRTMPGFSTFPEALQHWATHRANQHAFIFRSPQGERHVQTYEQIYHHGGRYAAVLRDGGARRGHLLANTLPNCPERVVCEAAILMTGAASVNAMCQLADDSDLLRTLRVSRAMAVLVDPDVTHSPWHVLEKYVTLGDDDSAMSEELPYLRRVYFVRRLPHSENDFLSKADPGEYMADDIKPDDVCTVFTTSGTNFSKLVAHIHEHVVQFTMPLPTDDAVFCSMAPLGWIGGHPCVTFMEGITRVLCDTKNGGPADMVDFMLKCFQEEKVTHSYIPSQYLFLAYQRVKDQKKAEGDLEYVKNRARRSQMLDFVLLGGHPITRSHMNAANLLGRSTSIDYGSTECMCVSMLIADPDNYQDFDAGLVLKDVEVKIVKEEDEDTTLPAGKAGRILVKKSVMWKEYLHDPEATAAAFTNDGFFRTGDVGMVDERGHLIVEGRGSDAIMRGPYIFYPGWLEERIHACPGVRDVIVVGVPDPVFHEEICACVVLKSSEMTIQQVQAFMEKEFVTSDEDPSPCPRHYLTFDVIPVTSTGKPHRKFVKQEAVARLSTSQ